VDERTSSIRQRSGIHPGGADPIRCGSRGEADDTKWEEETETMTTAEIEVAVAHWFGVRTHVIVPNISWGLGIHECDLLVVTGAGYAVEVEIKISRSDLIADKKKSHEHKSRLIRRLFFAMPESMEKDIEHVPAHAGIILVHEGEYGRTCRLLRPAKNNADAKPLSAEKRYDVARLGAMRIWNMALAINNLARETKNLRNMLHECQRKK